MAHRSMHHKLPRAITFYPTIGFSRSISFQKQEVKIFLKVSGSIHFGAFQGQQTYKGCRLENTQNTHQSFLILLSSPKIQGIVLIPNLPFLSSTFWIWGLEVWM